MCIDVCSAALLKDIRIGEHNGFTRIVFVFDAQPSDSRVEALSEKKVRITINAVKPDLMRKIKVEHTRKVEDIRILTEKQQLSTIFELGSAHTKVSSFQMEKPPRLVFDFFWQTTAARPESQRGLAPEMSSAELSTIETGPEPKAAANPTEETVFVEPQMDTTPSALPVESETEQSEVLLPRGQQAADAEKESEANTAQAPTEATVQEKTLPSDLPLDRAQESQQTAGWLQYYLVIALVIMTIAILFLLVVMLISKYRPAKTTARLGASEYLTRQEEHLSSIDDRIKEQLKRYDEA